MDVTIVILGLLAAGMAWVTAALVRWAHQARTVTSAGVVLFLFGMMVAMLAGALLYYLHPGNASLVEGLWVASAAMSLSVFPLFLLFLQDLRRRMASGELQPPTPLRGRQAFALSVVTLALFNEFLMGWTFQLASSGPAAPPWGAWGSALAYGVNSPWFLFPMALEMALTAYLLRRELPRQLMFVLVTQAAMMAFSPPALSFPGWVPVSVVANGALMFVVFAYPMERIYHRHALVPHLPQYLLALLPIFGAMLAGLVLWVVEGNGALFALSVLVQMAAYFEVVIFADRFSSLEDRTSGAAVPTHATSA